MALVGYLYRSRRAQPFSGNCLLSPQQLFASTHSDHNVALFQFDDGSEQTKSALSSQREVPKGAKIKNGHCPLNAVFNEPRVSARQNESLIIVPHTN